MEKLFCIFGLHSWVSWEEWFPSFTAPIVSKVTFFRECSHCGKRNDTVMNFDEKTGSPIDIWQSYNVLKSWDEVICLCEYCCSYGLEGVYHSIGVFYERNDGIAFRAAFYHNNHRRQQHAR